MVHLFKKVVLVYMVHLFKKVVLVYMVHMDWRTVQEQLINPRCTWAARGVTLVCLFVCLYVSHFIQVSSAPVP